MSIVMSTMAKQQNPGAFKLNAICEKLKKTSEEGDDDDMNDFELLGDNNNSGSGSFYTDRFCQNGSNDVALRGEQCTTPQSTSSAIYNEDSNSNPECNYYGMSGETPGYLQSEDPGSPMMDVEAQEMCLDATGGRTSCSGDGGGGSSRKNKRKNFKPRNIVYQYESCEDVDSEFVPEYPASESETMLVTKVNSFPESSRDLNRHLDQYSQEYASKEAEQLSSLEDEPIGQDHEQPLDLSGDTGAGGAAAKRTLIPRRADGAGTPIDLSLRNLDSSSDNSCTSSEDGHNGFAIDLSKGSDGWAVKDCVSLVEMESSSSCSDCQLTTTSCYSACDGISLSTATTMTIAGGGQAPPPCSPSPVGAVSRESPTSSSRSALGTGDSSPGRISPFPLPPTLTAITTCCCSSSTTTTTSTDACTMKDYAESTMKELLSLYGLNDMAESITKNVPLDNFSSGKILETMSPRMIGCPVVSTPTSGGMVPPTPVQNPRPPSNSQRTPSPLPASSTPSAPVLNNQSVPSVTMHYPSRTSASDGMYNSLCTKVVDSMTKLASLPPNSIIGNPRVILPPNMTSTILTLAAMQESKYAAAAMAAAVSNPSPKPPMLEPMTSRPVMKPQPSVIVSSSSSSGPSKDHLSKAGPIDYTRYVRRFSNATECGSNYCKDLNYREHFHCMDCNSRVFVKKEEMIRHFKWHKKRDESLQHGFLRFSPMDDCSDKFPGCSHNRKQTHYHCLKDGCDKVYISTSDVQMHANYHRKDSAIIQEGFQRYRATEDCRILSCSFYGQRTTHFHCRRSNCNYTFKNKADMEKHKTYHIKDEQLNKDGFKKFMKHEHCSFESCRFSRVCNHIHCIRAGCTYVLHSSGQLYSHKRKHERRENEMAYRKFKLAQSMLKTFSENHAYGFTAGQLGDEGNSSESTSSGVHMSNAIPVIQSTVNATATSSGGGPMQSMAGTPSSNPPVVSFSNHHQNLSYPSIDSHSLNQLANFFTAGVNLNTSFGLPIPLIPSGTKPVDHLLSAAPLGTVATMPTSEHLAAIDLSNDLLKPKPDDSWKRYLTRYTANDPCKPNCEFLYKDHYHCTTDNCVMMFRSKDGVREHARTHEQQEQVTEAFFTTVEVGQMHLCPNDCPYQSKEKHYHCCWESCREIILPSDKPFRRLDHYKMHDYARKSNAGKDHLNMTLATSLDGMFKRKRGRPPKNRIIEFPVSSNPSDLPQAIFTSFKLPKPNPLALNPPIPCTTAAQTLMEKHGTPISAVATPFGLLPAALLPQSIVSTPPITSIATTALPMATHISPSIKPKVEVQEGFYIFPKNIPCPDQLCLYSRQLHYHCTQPRCYYVTDRIEILTLHSRDFHGNVEILKDFAYYDRDVDCRLTSCTSNRVNRHYHCTKPNCNFSFVRYSMMALHDQSHKENESKTIFSVAPPLNHQSSPPPPTLPALRPILPSESPSPSDSLSPPVICESVTKTTVVKATGTFYPLSAFPQHNQKKNLTDSHGSNDSEQPSSFDIITNNNKNDDQSLSKLLLQPTINMQQFDWNGFLENHVEFGPSHPCGQPFCKLKKAEHYHCNICNQAISGFGRLQSHIQKHTSSSSAGSPNAEGADHTSTGDEEPAGGIDEDEQQDEHEDTDENENNNSNVLPPANSTSNESLKATSVAPPAVFTSAIPEAPLYFSQVRNLASVAGYHNILSHTQSMANMEERNSPCQNGVNEIDVDQSPQESSVFMSSGLVSPIREDSAESTPNCWLSGSRKRNPSPRCDEYGDMKRPRVPSSISSLRILKDEPVPDGYIRYRFNEDCHYQHCGYREHQTHFHCIRRDCGYSFCDKTRFVQHTARHERLDTLMGGDFQQFRANVACGRPDCLYTITMSTTGTSGNKASHFHCLKCDFVCTDTNKVVAHRRQHQKLDSIMAAGFEKFTPAQNCNIEGCSHNQKQTHYHCMKCQYAVLGLSQMSAHKYRHLE